MASPKLKMGAGSSCYRRDRALLAFGTGQFGGLFRGEGKSLKTQNNGGGSLPLEEGDKTGRAPRCSDGDAEPGDLSEGGRGPGALTCAKEGEGGKISLNGGALLPSPSEQH